VVLVVPGYGGRTGWAAPLAEKLLPSHPLVYGLNLKAMDADPAERMPFNGADDLMAEIREALAALRQAHRGPITLVSTSVGGLLSTLVASERPEGLSSLVLIAPAWRPSRDLVNPLIYLQSAGRWVLQRMGLRKGKHFTLPNVEPVAAPAGTDPAKAKRENAMVVTPGMMLSFLKTAYFKRIFKQMGQITLPTLVVVPGQDKMCSPESMRTGFAALGSTQKQIVELPQARHNLIRDAEIGPLSDSIAQWLKQATVVPSAS
jgi:alpha-beta hydrolase superfamily lysophospholipase